jgi:membrane-associated phospholipid phosphatase
VFLIMLPIFVVRNYELLRNTMRAYLLIWITAYAFFFVIYPTVAPRPEYVSGEGFGMWGLGALYGADPPYNCFPSLHVAHSFVSASACSRVHHRLGVAAIFCAAIVALSTLFTKQHYVLDVVTGVALAWLAYVLFLRRFSPEQSSELDRAAAPSLALVVGGVVIGGLAGSWLVYALVGQTFLSVGP